MLLHNVRVYCSIEGAFIIISAYKIEYVLNIHTIYLGNSYKRDA